MKNERRILFASCVSSVICSIVALSFSAFHIESYQVDYVATLGAFMGALITFLIGFQIYTFLNDNNFKKQLDLRFKSQEKRFSGFKKEIYTKIYNINNNITDKIALESGPSDVFLFFRFEAIDCLLRTDNFKMSLELINQTIEILDENSVHTWNTMYLQKEIRRVSVWVDSYEENKEIKKKLSDLFEALINFYAFVKRAQ